ncbi:MAG: metal-sensing transcriptional repressor [Sandaracinaceae bacterium]|nr:metal-sensing transcriptional repressor [Sandaracinaceae bacterium]
MDEDTRKKTVARLRRAAGQVDGVARMVAEEREVGAVLVQIAAARAALGRAAALLLEEHVRHAIEDAVQADDAARDRLRAELLDVFSRYCTS